MAHRLLKIAALYFVVAVCLGTYMGAAQDFDQIAVHAHLNLLGWVSLAIIGCIYLLKPHLATTRLAAAHFWLHNIGTPALMAVRMTILSNRLPLMNSWPASARY